MQSLPQKTIVFGNASFESFKWWNDFFFWWLVKSLSYFVFPIQLEEDIWISCLCPIRLCISTEIIDETTCECKRIWHCMWSLDDIFRFNQIRHKFPTIIFIIVFPRGFRLGTFALAQTQTKTGMNQSVSFEFDMNKKEKEIKSRIMMLSCELVIAWEYKCHLEYIQWSKRSD